MLLAERQAEGDFAAMPSAMVPASPASHRPRTHRSSGVARELAAAVPNSAADPGTQRSGPPTPGSTNRVVVTPDGSQVTTIHRAAPKSPRRPKVLVAITPTLSAAGIPVCATPECNPDSERTPRPFKVDVVAPHFYEEALPLFRDEQWSDAELYRMFLDRHGYVSKSSFYRWCEVRLVEGIPPAPIAENRSDAGWQPTPHDVLNSHADPMELQSRIILDLALRLPRGEIEMLDAQLSPLRAAESISFSETVLLRAVRARQSYDLAMERDAHFWVI